MCRAHRLVLGGFAFVALIAQFTREHWASPGHYRLSFHDSPELRKTELQELCREVPVSFELPGDLSECVAEDVLRRVLDRAVPHWNPPSVPIMMHAIRLWGTEAEFEVADGVPRYTGSCSAFVHIMSDDGECTAVLPTLREFLMDSDYGVSVVTSGDLLSPSIDSEGHCDQLLKAFAESGVRSDHKLTTSSGRVACVRDVVADFMARFSPDQELEFTLIAYSRWLPPTRCWNNRFGERFCFDDVVHALLQAPIGKGACQGCHSPYSLVCVFLADKRYPGVLSPASRQKIEDRLTEISLRLEQNELAGGGWDKRWSGEYAEAVENVFFEFKPHFDRISVTGHQLEWIVMVPSSMRPSTTVIKRAFSRLASDILALSEEDLSKPKGYLPLTHAAKAMVMARGDHHAYAFWRSSDRGVGVPRQDVPEEPAN